MHDLSTTPNRLPWPPLILAGSFVIALLLEWFIPTDLQLPAGLGYVLIAAALALDVWAMWTMAKARTNILPHRAADRLVTEGPFGFSRNPIYLGNALLIVGAGFAIDAVWFLLVAPVAVAAMHNLAILREESHLASRFGPAWDAYAKRTPRWLGLAGRD